MEDAGVTFPHGGKTETGSQFPKDNVETLPAPPPNSPYLFVNSLAKVIMCKFPFVFKYSHSHGVGSWSNTSVTF